MLALLKYWKCAAGALLLAVVWWQIHSYGSRRYEAGKSHVQVKWDDANTKAKAVADAKTRENELQDAADAARNLEIEHAHAKELAAAAADRGRLERQLRNAIATAGRGPASQGAGQRGTTDPGPPGSAEPPDPTAGLAGDIAAALIEARQNADQLDRLRQEIIPQM
jgi:hypothetical protein